MFTTKEAFELILKSKIGLTLVMSSDPNIHIFKNVDGGVSRGIYGDGSIINIHPDSYPYEKWTIDFNGSKFRTKKH